MGPQSDGAKAASGLSRSNRSLEWRTAMMISIAVLVVWNVLGNTVVSGPGSFLLNLIWAAVLLALARSAGVSWNSMGWSPGLAAAGFRRGLIAAIVVTAAVALLAALPLVNGLLGDDRFIGVDVSEMLFEVFARIPLATALPEELAFRGALLGLLMVSTSPKRAAIVSSVLFGLWHILPAIDALDTSTFDDGSGALGTFGAVSIQVVVTAVAGYGFCLLRLRAGHLIAPVLVHWALNGSAYFAGWLLVRHAWA